MNGKWLPILASLGVGAAAYYTFSKNNNSVGQTIQKMIPFVSQMSNAGNMQSS